MLESRRLRVALIALLLGSAALFAVGVAKERHDIKHERARAAAAAALQTTTAIRTGESATPRSTARGESTAKRAAERAGGQSPTESGTNSGEPATARKGEGTGAQTTTNPATGESAAKRAAEGAGTPSAAKTGASGGESAAKRKSEGIGGQTRANPASTGESAAKLASEGGVESAAQLRSEGSSERIFGINTESTALVISAVAVSVLLALAVWLAPGLAIVLLVVLGLGTVSAVFDVREAAHQATEHRDTLEAIAIVVAAMHVAVAVLAVGMLRTLPGRRTATA
jgi:multisubunit Na+/H+ antiporter MnhB subunit